MEEPSSERTEPLLSDFSLKMKIVATKEGGAITGEERIREHTDHLYSALISWEGKPARYLLDRTDALRRELKDVEAEFAQLGTQIHAMNLQLAPAPPPGMTSPCLHGEWERCGAKAALDAR